MYKATFLHRIGGEQKTDNEAAGWGPAESAG